MEQKITRPHLTVSELFLQLLRDPERKSIFRIFYEFLFLFARYRAFPVEYFNRYLFKKDKTNLLDYYPWRFLYKIKAAFNEKDLREVLENKLYYDLYYSQFNISLPKILMFNYQKMFVINKKSIEVNNIGEFKTLLAGLFKNDSSDESIIIKKTYWSYGGDKIYKLRPHHLTSGSDMIDDIYNEVIKAGYLFQETIIQHPDLDKLNPSCVNTIRIDTYTDPQGKIEIISAYIRMSFRNCVVDNISMGGCMVGVDCRTGKLRKEGFSNLSDLGVTILTEHPVTKTVFENLAIPYFEEAKELVLSAAKYMPGLRLVGWDVAISETGPVLVEGNSDYDNTGNDLSEGGYRNNPVFLKVLEEYKTIKNKKK